MEFQSPPPHPELSGECAIRRADRFVARYEFHIDDVIELELLPGAGWCRERKNGSVAVRRAACWCCLCASDIDDNGQSQCTS